MPPGGSGLLRSTGARCADLLTPGPRTTAGFDCVAPMGRPAQLISPVAACGARCRRSLARHPDDG